MREEPAPEATSFRPYGGRRRNTILVARLPARRLGGPHEQLRIPQLTEALLRASSHWRARQEADASASSALPTACTITISREAGALGSTIGQELANRLKWQLYDQNLLERIGAEMGLRASLLDSVDERRANWLGELLEGFQSRPGPMTPRFVHHLVEMILSLAAHGECVIVGRAAGHVLPPESTLRVRLVAPREFRVGVIQKARGTSAEAAARWIDDTDRERSGFVKAHFNRDTTDPTLYDLVLNVSRFSVPQATGLIIAALRDLEQNRRSR